MKFSKLAATSAFALLAHIPALAQSAAPTRSISLTASNTCTYLSPDCTAHTEGLKLRLPTRNWGELVLTAENFREKQGENYINAQVSHPAVGHAQADAAWSAEVKGQRVSAELLFRPSTNTSLAVGAYAGQVTGIMTQYEHARADLQLKPDQMGLPANLDTVGVSTAPLTARLNAVLPKLNALLGNRLPANVLSRVPGNVTLPVAVMAPYSEEYAHDARREAKSAFGGISQAFEYAPPLGSHTTLRVGQSLHGGIEGATARVGVGITYRTDASSALVTTPNGACNGDPATPTRGGAVTVAFCASKMVYAPLYKKMKGKADYYADRFNGYVNEAAQDENLQRADVKLPQLTGQNLLDIMKVTDPRQVVPTLDVGYAHQVGKWSAKVGVSVPLKTNLKRDVTGNASLSYNF